MAHPGPEAILCGGVRDKEFLSDAFMKRRDRWPVVVKEMSRVVEDDLSAFTTAEDRLAMMWPLAHEAWSLAGLDLPDYSRDRAPVHVTTDPA